MSGRNERKHNMKVLSHVYRRIDGFDLTRCHYCGEIRESIDHCPPLSLAINMDIAKFKESGGQLLLIPSCERCNRMLGNKPLFTLLERLDHLRSEYMKLIIRLDKAWTDDELSELGYNLKQFISARVSLVRKYTKQLRGIEQNMAEL